MHEVQQLAGAVVDLVLVAHPVGSPGIEELLPDRDDGVERGECRLKDHCAIGPTEPAKPLRIEEFAPEKKWWGKRKENDQAWKVSIEDIKARGYNLDIKNPRAVDDGPGDADELLKQYREAATEAAKIRDQLRDELRAALEGARG